MATNMTATCYTTIFEEFRMHSLSEAGYESHLFRLKINATAGRPFLFFKQSIIEDHKA